MLFFQSIKTVIICLFLKERITILQKQAPGNYWTPRQKMTRNKTQDIRMPYVGNEYV